MKLKGGHGQLEEMNILQQLLSWCGAPSSSPFSFEPLVTSLGVLFLLLLLPKIFLPMSAAYSLPWQSQSSSSTQLSHPAGSKLYISDKNQPCLHLVAENLQ